MDWPSPVKNEEELMINDTKSNLAGASRLDSSETSSFGT